MSSQNKKLGPVAATYASIEATCPTDCRLKGQGCYGQLGRVGMHARRLDRSEGHLKPLAAARAEAELLDAQRTPLGRPIRLHVSGDCRTPAAARTLAASVRRWMGRGGGTAWTYTHGWRRIARADWGAVSVLGSVTSLRDAPRAMDRGYAPAVVVEDFPTERAFDAGGIELVPCPEQTRGVTCAECQLCLNSDALLERGQGIAFRAHSNQRRRVLAVLR